MKKISRVLFFTVFLMLIFICFPSLVHAQIDPSCDPQDPACPIDGGLSLLLAAGIGYGMIKIRSSHKKDASAV
ncbi:MAG: hypothetical protein M3Z92_05900 [Bacteroidota bacterium]|nr:hypothetical protein [Bacteroidota bacterium]